MNGKKNRKIFGKYGDERKSYIVDNPDFSYFLQIQKKSKLTVQRKRCNFEIVRGCML